MARKQPLVCKFYTSKGCLEGGEPGKVCALRYRECEVYARNKRKPGWWARAR